MSEAQPRATILVVDDVPANIGLLLEALSREGYRVLVAESGESALAQLPQGWPDAILLDYRLPGIDGVEVCRRVRAMPGGAEVPILFLTAVGDIEEKVRVLDAGAVDYITKPIETAEVLARVRTHLRIAALQRQLAARQRALQDEMELRLEAEGLLRDSLDQALVVSTAGGRVLFATRGATTLLALHFPAHPRDVLPGPLLVGAGLPGGLSVRRCAGRPGADLAVLELHDPGRAGPAALLDLGLTPREAEILYWLAEGKTNDAIATILGSSRRTVEKHVEHVFEKLGVENRASAARIAAGRLAAADPRPPRDAPPA
jgi:DNA-binding response OmpR family regulator/DNA-binding CsgD family transcriptional regulator